MAIYDAESPTFGAQATSRTQSPCPSRTFSVTQVPSSDCLDCYVFRWKSTHTSRFWQHYHNHRKQTDAVLILRALIPIESRIQEQWKAPKKQHWHPSHGLGGRPRPMSRQLSRKLPCKETSYTSKKEWKFCHLRIQQPRLIHTHAEPKPPNSLNSQSKKKEEYLMPNVPCIPSSWSILRPDFPAKYILFRHTMQKLKCFRIWDVPTQLAKRDRRVLLVKEKACTLAVYPWVFAYYRWWKRDGCSYLKSKWRVCAHNSPIERRAGNVGWRESLQWHLGVLFLAKESRNIKYLQKRTISSRSSFCQLCQEEIYKY